MPSEGQRLHGFTVVSGALRIARQLLLPAIIGGASVGDDFFTTLQWVVLLLTVPALVAAVARWLMFRYRLEGDELIIDSGVLSRRRRVIPLVRIQNVDLQQSAVERLAGVAELRMETASGGAETEASLSVLSLPEARDLQAELMRRRAEARGRDRATAASDAAQVYGTPAAPGPDERPRRLIRLSVADLALAGATSNEAGVIAAALVTVLEVAGDVGYLALVEPWIDAAFTRGAAVGLVGAVVAGAAIVLGMIVVGWVVSIFVNIVRYHGFTLTRIGDDIRREYGLVSRHYSSIPLERVQAVRIEESLLRRPFGLVSLKIETAGASPQQRQRDGGSEAFVPIAWKRDVGPLLREVFPDARFEGVEMHSVSPLSMRRGFLRLATPIAAVTLVATVLAGPRWLALLALLVPAWLYARAAYRARGWGRPGAYTLVRGGVFTRVNWVVPESKIQTLHVAETPFQRRLALGSLLVDTAAGGRVARVVDLDRATAVSLLADLGADAERHRRRGLRAGLPEPR